MNKNNILNKIKSFHLTLFFSTIVLDLPCSQGAIFAIRSDLARVNAQPNMKFEGPMLSWHGDR